MIKEKLNIPSNILLDSLSDAIIITDSGNAVYHNVRYCEFFSGTVMNKIPLHPVLYDSIFNISDAGDSDFILLKPEFRRFKIKKIQILGANQYIFLFNNISDQISSSIYQSKFLGIITHKFQDTIKHTARCAGKISENNIPEFNTNIDFLYSLTNKLFYFFRETTGPLRIFPKICSLEKLITASIQTVSSRLVKKNSTLDFKYIDVDPKQKFIFDMNAIQTVLTTIIDNAITFSYSETPITVEVTYTNGDLSFSVTNLGKGVPLEDEKNIMQCVFLKFLNMITVNSESEWHM